MKKYDVKYTERFDGYLYGDRFVERVEANNEEEAKQIIINKYKDKSLSWVKVKEAEDYICWTYNSEKLSDGTYGFKKEYYVKDIDLRPFGIGVVFSSKQEDAKRFQTEYELKQEIKRVGRKISDYKIEKVKI